MRIIGFFGIFLLSILDIFCLIIAIQRFDWKGIVLVLLFAGMLVFFARTLWLGRRFEGEAPSGDANGRDWAYESVSSFIRNQVAKSLEGRILIAGSAVSFVFALAALFVPGVIGLPPDQGSANAVTFGMWPFVAFVSYVRICGPDFQASLFNVVLMLVVVAAPFAIAYK